MKTSIKIILIIVFALGIMFINSKVQAASASISASKTSATVGDSVTISVSINAAAWNLRVSGNGISGDSIVGYDSDGNNTTTSKTFTLNTSSAGTYTVSLSGDVTDGATDVNSPINKSVTVTVSAPVTPPSGNTSGGNSASGGGSSSSGGSSNTNPKPNTTTTPKPDEVKKSNDATLKSLSIEGYELYPEFNSAVNEYNVKVTNDVTSVKIVPEVNDSKANFTIEGTYENLEVGENIANVLVTAEDGSTNRYVIKINREREKLKLQTLKITYVDELGNEVVLTPELVEETFEYILADIPYYISTLNIEVLSNLENAQIEVIGNEELLEGENVITIKITMTSESEEEEDEVLTYTFKVNKEVAPKVTVIGKIKNWFKGITGTVGTWFNKNQYKIVIGSLMLCSAAMGGLTVYLIIDYKKYKKLLQKIAEVTRMNAESVNYIQTEGASESIDNTSDAEDEKIEETVKPRGRHF